MRPGAFGCYQPLPVLKPTRPFGETVYVCDAQQMLDEIHTTEELLYTEWARHPCAVEIHATDWQHLRQLPQLAPCFKGPGVGRLFGMLVVVGPTATRGHAQLMICAGCLSRAGICANKQVWK